MRILIIGINFFPELTGTGKYTGEMAVYLSEKGHEIRVVTAPPYYPQWKIQPGYKSYRYQPEKLANIVVYRCPLWVPRKPTGLTRLLHLFSFTISSLPVVLNQKKWKPEIIISIAPSLFSAFPAQTLAKLTGAKTWLHVQDFELDAAFDLGLLQRKALIYKIATCIEKRLFKQFDRVSTISQRMLERLHQKSVANEKTVLFPNWIDSNLIMPLTQPNNLRKEWGILDGQVVVLYSGNMGRKQGLETLVEAARLLTDMHEIVFILCGEGVACSELEESSQGLLNIRFYPLQPMEKLNELLNLADIHILPQRVDAADLVMPSKLSGMLASGKVVVATASPTSELGSIVSEVGILSPPEDPMKLSENILALAANSAKRVNLGVKGRNWVVSHWEKRTVLQEFEARLRSMLESQIL
jgi:colanic acid biosynthesis glycosyl transferase WcaI